MQQRMFQPHKQMWSQIFSVGLSGGSRSLLFAERAKEGPIYIGPLGKISSHKIKNDERPKTKNETHHNYLSHSDVGGHVTVVQIRSRQTSMSDSLLAMRVF